MIYNCREKFYMKYGVLKKGAKDSSFKHKWIKFWFLASARRCYEMR